MFNVQYNFNLQLRIGILDNSMNLLSLLALNGWVPPPSRFPTDNGVPGVKVSTP